MPAIATPSLWRRRKPQVLHLLCTHPPPHTHTTKRTRIHTHIHTNTLVPATASRLATVPWLASVCLRVRVHVCATGWRRLIEWLKLQVIFRKRATNYEALWREMTYEDKASLKSSPPSTYGSMGWLRSVESIKL